ncbi:MAG: DUF342 domain-containing protein [Phycisphaerales bacterium]|jgi:uncharacterized protein (DUF342 family)|nr:DUF342 domain-containing protein [Phycisphaerales bacterium]
MSADPDSRLKIILSDDASVATLRIDAGVDTSGIDEPALTAVLQARGIQITPAVKATLGRVMAEIRTFPGRPIQTVVSRGLSPQPGVEGRFEPPPQLARCFEPATPDQSAAARQAVPADLDPTDHYGRASVNAVAAGDRLGTLVPPVPGTDGRDVTGKAINAAECRPFPLDVDDSVRIEPDGSVVAAVAGIVQWDPPRLRIRQQMRIAGYVDFASGNVNFPGDVLVERGVRDRFQLAAGGSLTVGGLIEAAVVSCGRDAWLLGGMAAKDQGSLRVRRDCRTHYLNSVNAEVGRDLYPTRELVNSVVTVGRDLIGPKCSMTGGRLAVARRCVLEVVGNSKNIPTEIELGSIPGLRTLGRTAQQLIPRLQIRADRAAADLATLKAATGKLTHAQAEHLTELEYAASQAMGRIGPLQDRILRISDLLVRHGAIDLTILGCLHAGVRIIAGQSTLTFTADVQGPIRLTVDVHGQPVCTEGYGINPGPCVDLAPLAQIARTPEELLLVA